MPCTQIQYLRCLYQSWEGAPYNPTTQKSKKPKNQKTKVFGTTKTKKTKKQKNQSFRHYKNQKTKTPKFSALQKPKNPKTKVFCTTSKHIYCCSAENFVFLFFWFFDFFLLFQMLRNMLRNILGNILGNNQLSCRTSYSRKVIYENHKSIVRRNLYHRKNSVYKKEGLLWKKILGGKAVLLKYENRVRIILVEKEYKGCNPDWSKTKERVVL